MYLTIDLFMLLYLIKQNVRRKKADASICMHYKYTYLKFNLLLLQLFTNMLNQQRETINLILQWNSYRSIGQFHHYRSDFHQLQPQCIYHQVLHSTNAQVWHATSEQC